LVPAKGGDALMLKEGNWPDGK